MLVPKCSYIDIGNNVGSVYIGTSIIESPFSYDWINSSNCKYVYDYYDSADIDTVYKHLACDHIIVDDTCFNVSVENSY